MAPLERPLMALQVERYLEQKRSWPKEGRHIMAQFDDAGVVVYQSYNPRIGHFAAQHGFFGGDFRLGRMTWIKPNFLWMMFRSGWGTKPDQEVTLAIKMKRAAFDHVLSCAVASSYRASSFADPADWKAAMQSSSVRLQWDPDHSPNGAKESRRAVQLGIRREMAVKYSKEWLLDIEDISDFVQAQRKNAPVENGVHL